jgi:hypothetical protein
MTEPTMNGASLEAPQDLDELTERNKQRIDAVTTSMQALELPTASELPFDQKAHDLLIKSIDQVAADWMSELAHTRHNSEQVGQLVLERATALKSHVTTLFLLGNTAMAEARRGDEINARLASELDKMTDQDQP